MKDEKKRLPLHQRTPEPGDQLVREGQHGFPVVFIDLSRLAATGEIDGVSTGPIVLVPRVCELTYVPAPEELQ